MGAAWGWAVDERDRRDTSERSTFAGTRRQTSEPTLRRDTSERSTFAGTRRQTSEPTLRVGAADDTFEREAGAAAAAVVRRLAAGGPSGTLFSGGARGRIRRSPLVVGACGSPEGPTSSSRIRTSTALRAHDRTVGAAVFASDDVCDARGIVGMSDATRRRRDDGVLRRMGDEELKQRGADIKELSTTAPVEGANLWRLSGDAGATLYLLGTMHGKLLAKLRKKGPLVNWLIDTKFDEVRAEIESPSLRLDATTIRDAVKNLEAAQATQTQNARTRLDIKRNTEILESAGSLDDVFTTLAAKGSPILGLETQQVRSDVRQSYQTSEANEKERHYGDTKELASSLFGLPESIEGDDIDRANELRLASQGDTASTFETTEEALQYQEQLLERFPEAIKQYGRRNRRVMAQIEEMVTSGNEQQLMKIHSEHLSLGIDVQDIEARNQKWVSTIQPALNAGKNILWVVGVSHLAGLTVELRKLGWKAESFVPPS